MQKKRPLIGIILALLLIIVGCQKKADATPEFTIQVMKNINSYVLYWNRDDDSMAVTNLVFNHSKSLKITPKDLSIELLPKTDIVSIGDFRMQDNPPVKGMAQKSLHIDFTSNKPGTHTFTQIAVQYKGIKKTYDLGQLRIDVRKGRFSGLTILSNGFGIFPQQAPLHIKARNPHAYPVKIKDVVLSNPNIQFGPADIRIGLELNPFPKNGYLLKPKETLPIQVNWKVIFPANQISNIEARPSLLSEHNGTLEYAGIPNMVFRNDEVLPNFGPAAPQRP